MTPTTRRLCAIAYAAFGVSIGNAAAPPTAQAYKDGVQACMRARDLACAEQNWVQYLRLRPTDANAYANLGIVMNQRDNQAGAIANFERAIDLGEGTYDLFAYYADSLEKSGRIDDAIDWSYKSLAVVPSLVDVRGKLAKLLVLRKRHYEALSLLASFDQELSAKGKPHYFDGQMIAIETALARQGGTPGAEARSLRLPKIGDHYYVPVVIGSARSVAFVVDTGASRATFSDDYLVQSKVVYKVVGDVARARIADGRILTGRNVVVSSLRVGGHELRDVSAFVCPTCVPLLGQNALSRFDLQSSKKQGVEFMTLTPR